VVQQEVNIAQCSPLFDEQFYEKRKKLFEMLQGAGYEIND
jgi:CO dehydrogenase/acetyl-CoA synthase gamma subunit (corrinoid Fe-S protein)